MSGLKRDNKVIYTGSSQEQRKWGSYTGDYTSLVDGSQYTIDKVEPHTWHTKLYLKEVQGSFNSVCFELALINETGM
jgi:hypothetical protein